MKILVVCQHYWPEPYRLSDICEEFVLRGHEVHVVTGVPNYPEGYIYDGYRRGSNRNQQRNGVRITRTFTIGRRKDPVFRLLNYFSFCMSSTWCVGRMKEDYDVILAYQTSPVMMANAALAYGRKHHIPVLLYCMDLWPASLRVGGVPADSALYRFFHWVSGRIYGGADAIAVSSQKFAEYLEREFGVEPQRIGYLPQYADNSFPPVPVGEKSALDLVFAGNVGAAQSIETILEAANLLREYEDIRWHIIGTGSRLEQSRKYCRKLGLNNVIFHGYLTGEALGEYYCLADTMLITLTADPVISLTLPMKLMSYMASGKPILASAGGAIAEVLAEAGCGYTVPAESPEKLAEAVLRFRSDPNRRAYGMKARSYYEANFSRERFMDQLEKSLEDLSSGGRRHEGSDHQFCLR